MTIDSSLAPANDIVARAGTYYRNARYILTAVLILLGVYFCVDGFYRYPRWPQTHPQEKPKTEMDILIQKVVGLSLPPIGLCLIGWTLYRSRGEYRLSADTLYAPGHPPVPLDAIQSVDRALWDRKGIALLKYRVKDADGTIKLDDFVYERDPTDEIFKRVERSLTEEGPASAATE